MGESRNAYRVLVGRLEGKRPLGRPRHRWEDNIRIDLREMGYDGRDWINVAQNRNRWRAYVRAEMNLRVQYDGTRDRARLDVPTWEHGHRHAWAITTAFRNLSRSDGKPCETCRAGAAGVFCGFHLLFMRRMEHPSVAKLAFYARVAGGSSTGSDRLAFIGGDGYANILQVSKRGGVELDIQRLTVGQENCNDHD
ncbi:hypothetical protein ANN_14110 [Periplaneta americana]|uniref:Uncharacterized protein n=1 Tax=Periplaneta americana TaxID=6978 RepID=A0ABQ8SWM0_PERAM|nr:hypothetical protein ANN_14110 [Periplaneta americana]